MRHLPLVSSLLSLTLLAACQQRPPSMPAGAMFSLTAATGAVVVPVTPAGRPEAVGASLTVNLQDFLVQFSGSRRVLASIAGSRRVLASIADVEQVVVVVTAADGQTVSQTLSRAAIAGGQTALTFTGLAAGDATISVEAFDAAHRLIGRAVQRAAVSAGVMAQVTMAVQLGGSSPSSGGRAGGATPPPSPTPLAPAELSAAVAINDSYVIKYVPPSPSFLTQSRMSGFAFDSAGQAWGVSGSTGYYNGLPGLGNGVMKLVPGASAEDIAYLDDVYEVVCDASDALWTTSLANTFVTRLDRQGVTLATAQVPEVPGPRSLAVDSSSQAWVANGRHVTRIAANGSLVGTYPVVGRVGAIAADPASGEIWVTVENTLVKLSAQGDVLATTPPFSTAPSNDFAGLAIDAAGHVWVSVLSDGTIAHFGPDGGFLSRHALGWPARDLAFDSAGHLWAVGGTNADPGSGRAAKLSASGRLLEVYMNAPSLIDTVVIAPNDQVWVKGIYGDVYRLAP